MKIHMFEILEKAKPNTEYVEYVNFVAVKHIFFKS
jgi:hypothetical protein